MSPAQHRAYETLRPRYALPYHAAWLDLAQAFARAAPTIVEIGSGMGETTAELALSEPARNILAIEVHKPGIASLVRRLDDAALENVRVIERDATEVLRDMIAPAGLAGVRIFFPDPWPKTRHHKRRLVQGPFIRLAAERLAPGGVLHVATDWEAYARSMQASLEREPLLVPCPPEASAAFARPVTKFERRGVALGHGVWDLRFMRADR